MRPSLQFQRRALIVGAGASALAVGQARGNGIPRGDIPVRPAPELAKIERATGGRLGVYAFAHSEWATVQHRAHERFPMCSTFKMSLAGALLQDMDHGRVKPDKWIPYGQADLLSYAPVARAHVAEGGMKLIDLCRAAVEVSDNTAANLLLAEIGGPPALTARWRVWGDSETRLDRNEPSLNSAIRGDPRDTTTPRAMLGSLEMLLAGGILTLQSTTLLRSWMLSCQTGLDKLRAGFPVEFFVGDKTGNNGKDTLGDIAFVDTPDHRGLFIVCYLTEAKVDAKAQAAAFADVARVVTAAFHLAPTHG